MIRRFCFALPPGRPMMHCDSLITKTPVLKGILVLFHVHLVKSYLKNLSRGEIEC